MDTGQYVVIAEAATLLLSSTTCTLRHEHGHVLFHQSLAALLFANSGAKLMLASYSRGPSVLVECQDRSGAPSPQDAASLVAALRGFGIEVKGPPPLHTPARLNAAELSAKLEGLVLDAGFQQAMADIEATFARRQWVGLPSLLAAHPT